MRANNISWRAISRFAPRGWRKPVSRHVFTYGSLMFVPVWTRLVPRSLASVAAVLEGFVREGVRRQRYPGIRREPGASTQGRLYLNVDEHEITRLDAFEGDAYQRESVQVSVATRDGRHLALPAEVYRFVDTAELDGAPWDPERFARDSAAGFHHDHAGRG